jgi:hypothetical protein
MANFGRFAGPPSVGEETTTYRKSPIGYEETDDETSPRYDATTEGGFFLRNGSFVPISSRYHKDSWDNPTTQTHERIHQGQIAANLPESEYFAKLVKSVLSGYQVENRSSKKFEADELPAYAFSAARDRPYERNKVFFEEHPQSPSLAPALEEEKAAKKQQEVLNNYLNLVQKIAPGRRHNVMAPMPEELQRGYINSGPGVEGFSLPEEQESVLSMIKRSLRGK